MLFLPYTADMFHLELGSIFLPLESQRGYMWNFMISASREVKEKMAFTWDSLLGHAPWAPWANTHTGQRPWTHCAGQSAERDGTEAHEMLREPLLPPPRSGRVSPAQHQLWEWSSLWDGPSPDQHPPQLHGRPQRDCLASPESLTPMDSHRIHGRRKSIIL